MICPLDMTQQLEDKERTEMNEFTINEGKLRIIQETVPAREISLAHIIAHPDDIIYVKLGLDPNIDYNQAAIGILSLSPAETAIIAGDVAMKSSEVQMGFLDRFSGTLIITGTLASVESSLIGIMTYMKNELGYTVCKITRT